jgi:hypothetical protein
MAVSMGHTLGFLGYHQAMMKEKDFDTLKMFISQKPKTKSEKWKTALYACKTENFELLKWVSKNYNIIPRLYQLFTLEQYYYMRCLQVLKDKTYYTKFKLVLDEIE